MFAVGWPTFKFRVRQKLVDQANKSDLKHDKYVPWKMRHEEQT
jgi:hypothetical protein